MDFSIHVSIIETLRGFMEVLPYSRLTVFSGWKNVLKRPIHRSNKLVHI